MSDGPSKIKKFFTDIPSQIKETYNDLYSQFRDTYYKSGAGTYFGDYRFKMKMTVVGVLLGTAVTSSLIHYLFFSFSLLRISLATIGLSISSSSATTLAFLYYPIYKNNADKSKLEDNLVYSLSYMTVLAATGMSIERIMARMADIERGTPIGRLAKKFTTNTRMFGQDVLTALKDISKRSPSSTFSKILYSIRTTIYTSGDLRSILSYEMGRQIQQKMEDLEKMLSSLTYIGELYVVMMVVGPILFILMLTILSVMGGGFGGSPVLQLNLITFFGIPFMGAVFILLLDMILGEGE